MKSSRKSLFYIILWTAFFNGVIASLISLEAITTQSPLESSLLALVYLCLQQIGHFQFFAFVFSLPLILIAVIWPDRTFIKALCILVFSLFIALIFIDYSVFKLYRFHLNGMVWNMLTGGALEEIFVFDTANVISASIFIGLVVLLQYGLQFYLARRAFKSAPISGWLVFAFILLIQLSGQTLYAWADAWYKTDVMAQLRFAPLPQPVTVKDYLRKQGWAPDIKQQPGLNSKITGRFNYPIKPIECQVPSKKPNILFIISDSLRFDMLQPDIMPNWYELSKQSQVFTHHVSNGNATRFGIFSLFSGLYGNYWFDALNTETGSVLINELKKQDYRFGLFANARLTSPEFDRTIFSSIKELIPEKTPGKDVLSREYEITRQAKAFLETRDKKPFFGLVFLDAPHAYVNPPQDNVFKPFLEQLNYLKLNNKTDPLPFLNRYKNAIHFNDRLTGEILQTMRQNELMENTIIVLTGDHGQEANETLTNSWGHNSNYSRYQTQVPLIIYWPGKEPRQYSQLTSHVDVVPTLMQSVFSCSNEITDYSNGFSLFNEQQRSFVLIKSWSSQAILNNNKVRVYPKIGPYKTYNYADYKTIQTDDFTAQTNAKLIESISRFYK
jgi:membrane-anchored protein YejM (alkaline phosphatase superfamily)